MNGKQHKHVKINQSNYDSEVQDELANQEKSAQSKGGGLSSLYSSVRYVNNDKIKIKSKSNIRRENAIQVDQLTKKEMETDKKKL
ncbi:MAG: hypothetical protein ACR5KV_01310 [Wolbachia sp.]